MKRIFTLLLLLLTFSLQAQEVDFHGNVRSLTDRKPLTGVTVINLSTSDGTTSDNRGYFSIEASPGDTIYFYSLGFEPYRIAATQEDNLHKNTIEMVTKFYEMDSVGIVGNRPINEAFLDIGSAPTPINERGTGSLSSSPNAASSLLNPVSSLKYLFSKKEREKVNFPEYLKNERKWARVNQIYTREFIQGIVGLEGESLDDFIIFCNKEVKLAPNDSEYDIKRKIIVASSQYKNKLNNEE